jgi:DNA-binding transcriptional MerR regulator
VRTLKTSEAAAVLNVSPNTLRAWERRFEYPKPQRSVGGHRMYAHAEIAALRDALQEGLSISSAISQARGSLRGDTAVLVGALNAFELDRADTTLEAALALRSVERTVEEVLLPALNELADRHGADSAPWAFAARWALEWLHRAQRFVPPATRKGSILIGDATRDEVDPDKLAVRGLELFLGRTGVNVLVLPVSGLPGLADVVAAAHPDAVVIAGTHDPDDTVARWAYGVRSTAGALPVALYHRATGRVRTTGAQLLSQTPSVACRELLALIDSGGRTDAVTSPLSTTELPASHIVQARRRFAS